MKNDFALTIIYTIATLGTITIALSPVKEENIKNIQYSIIKKQPIFIIGIR